MLMKYVVFIPLFLLGHALSGQAVPDAWITAQLGDITWQETYKGVLADYHPIILVLATDQSQLAGFLVHQGDLERHNLLGEWTKSGRFQLQERDEYDRLTGYLTGTVTNDQVQMKWMSADQSRLFDVKAFPERLIKIKNFKPAAEWIEIGGTPTIYLSVQKMDYGIVSGIAGIGGHYARFEGSCLDGTCSMWKTTITGADGTPVRIQMRQKDQVNYKATVNGAETMAEIKFVTPLAVRQFGNSRGFLDFVYPQLNSKSYEQWLAHRIDSLWENGLRQLTADIHHEDGERLAYRASGWIEIIDEGPSYVSGMITFINPDLVHREAFLWLKKEDIFLSQQDLVNAQDDVTRASGLALASAVNDGDTDYLAWLQNTGYSTLLPTEEGVAMATTFNMVYGDEMRLLSPEESKSVIKRKYWKYFGW